MRGNIGLAHVVHNVALDERTKLSVFVRAGRIDNAMFFIEHLIAIYLLLLSGGIGLL